MTVDIVSNWPASSSWNPSASIAIIQKKTRPEHGFELLVLNSQKVPTKSRFGKLSLANLPFGWLI